MNIVGSHDHGVDDEALDRDRDPFIYDGTVVENNDPEKRYRVKVKVPGLFEPTSDWLTPYGGPWSSGGGCAIIGAPPKGAVVGVFFRGGYKNKPAYIGGPFTPGDIAEIPNDPEAVGHPDVRFICTPSFIMMFDEREGQVGWRVIDRKSGQVINIDSTNNSMEMRATTALKASASGIVDISGAQTNIQGRPVKAKEKPIE